MSEVNVPLLRKVLEHITEHPEEWKQGYYGYNHVSCGTAYCVAGHVAVMTGHKLVWNIVDGDEREAEYVVTDALDQVHIAEVAAEALGLTHREGGRLFHGDNTLVDLWQLASHITDGEIVVPEQLPELQDRFA